MRKIEYFVFLFGPFLLKLKIKGKKPKPGDFIEMIDPETVKVGTKNIIGFVDSLQEVEPPEKGSVYVNFLPKKVRMCLSEKPCPQLKRD